MILGACCEHVEGGLYIGPEFQLGQVYDGTLGTEEGETIVLYRPVYVYVKKLEDKSNEIDNPCTSKSAGINSTSF